MTVAVTGGSGKLGRSVVRRLVEDGNDVVNLDRAGERGPALVVVDLTDYGQVETSIIAAADTVMSRSSAGLAAEVFPDVEVVRDLGEHETLLSIDKARQLLGYAPEHSWRDPAAPVDRDGAA